MSSRFASLHLTELWYHLSDTKDSISSPIPLRLAWCKSSPFGVHDSCLVPPACNPDFLVASTFASIGNLVFAWSSLPEQRSWTILDNADGGFDLIQALSTSYVFRHHVVSVPLLKCYISNRPKKIARSKNLNPRFRSLFFPLDNIRDHHSASNVEDRASPAQKRQKQQTPITSSTFANKEALPLQAPTLAPKGEPLSSPNARKRRASQSPRFNTLPPGPSNIAPDVQADVSIPTPLTDENGKKRGRTNTPWTPQEEQLLKRMRDEGLSWSEIAKVCEESLSESFFS